MAGGETSEVEKQTESSAPDDPKNSLSTIELVPAPGTTTGAADLTKEPDFNSAFSLGEDDSKLLTRTELHQQNPELESMMRDVAGMGGRSGLDMPIKFDGMQDVIPSSVYKFDAFRQMIAKYGVDRVAEMFDALKQINPDGLDGDRSLLSFSGDAANWPKHNERLYNMAALCEPGKLEAVKDLVGKMRSEGYEKTFDLLEMNPTMIALLSNDAKERAAFIEFENTPTMTPGFFLKDHPEIDVAHTLPSQVLAEFKNYEADKQ